MNKVETRNLKSSNHDRLEQGYYVLVTP